MSLRVRLFTTDTFTRWVCGWYIGKVCVQVVPHQASACRDFPSRWLHVPELTFLRQQKNSFSSSCSVPPLQTLAAPESTPQFSSLIFCLQNFFFGGFFFHNHTFTHTTNEWTGGFSSPPSRLFPSVFIHSEETSPLKDSNFVRRIRTLLYWSIDTSLASTISFLLNRRTETFANPFFLAPSAQRARGDEYFEVRNRVKYESVSARPFLRSFRNITTHGKESVARAIPACLREVVASPARSQSTHLDISNCLDYDSGLSFCLRRRKILAASVYDTPTISDLA
jgi:hypothetical protein